MARVRVELGNRSYEVVIAWGALDSAAQFAARHHDAVALVHDQAVAAMSGRLEAALMAAGVRVARLEVAGGEACKSLSAVEEVLRFLQRERIARDGAVIAHGGGTIGDMAGFAASIWLRGVACIQIPTTLLAMVDSSLGGKTGVDLEGIKNAVGTVWQPEAVFADPSHLDTLPAEQRRSGMAEVIKYGVALDAGVLALLPGDLEPLIARCAALKAEIVAEDELDSGRRAVLNYGHTVGHAIEAASGHSVLHGVAVAHGMRAAAHIAELIGMCPPGLGAEQDRLLAAQGLPGPPLRIEPGAVLEALAQDKKSRAGEVRWVLPRRIGHAEVGIEAPAEAVREAVARVLA